MTAVQVTCNQVCETRSGQLLSTDRRVNGEQGPPAGGARRLPWVTRALAEGLPSADTGAHWTLLASSRDSWIRPVLCVGTLRVSGLPQITGKPQGCPPAIPAGSSLTPTPISLLHEQEEGYFQH